MLAKIFKKKPKWHRTFNGDFIDIREPLNKKDINELLLLDNLDRIQLSPPLDRFENTFKLLNDHFYSERPEVGFRVYGHSEEITNLNFLSVFNNLKRFSIQEWHLEDISSLIYLKDLEELSVGEIKTKKLSYAPIADLKKLRRLYVTGTKKDMDKIAELPELQYLSLHGVTLDSLEIFLPLHKLTELHISLGGIRNYEHLPQIGKIEKLGLTWIRELPEENLLPIAKMKFLKSLEVNRLPHIKSIQWLQNSKSLNELILDELKGLESLKGIENIDNLQKITVATRAKNKTIEPILKCKNLKELWLPLIWGRDNLMKVHAKHPEFKLDEYINDYDRRMKELKSSSKNS